MSTFPMGNKESAISLPELNFFNTDRTGDVPIMLRGGLWRTSGGSWNYQTMPSTFQISTVGMATAGVDYSCILPSGTQIVNIKVRGLNGTTVSCGSGVLSANPYFTMVDTQTETIGSAGSALEGVTLHFSPDANNTTMELVVYS
jgi:hypothetical protein